MNEIWVKHYHIMSLEWNGLIAVVMLESWSLKLEQIGGDLELNSINSAHCFLILLESPKRASPTVTVVLPFLCTWFNQFVPIKQNKI